MSMSEISSTSFANDPEADITVQSSDGSQFHLQRKYLSINTGAFPGAEFDTRGEITHLTEPSVVLDVLFHFVYPKRHPDLDDLDFKLVSAIAEAAEKYEVFAAMNVCRVRMKQFLPEHAMDILAYAARHDYPKLITEAAPHLVLLPLIDVVGQLPTRYIEPWVRYHTSYQTIFSDALKSLMDIRVAQPNSNPRTALYLSSNAPVQVCHACLFTMVAAIKELEGLTSVKALEEELKKPRVAPNFCLSPLFCQYVSVLGKVCGDIGGKMKVVPAFGRFVGSVG